MSTEALVKHLQEYIHGIIYGFESGIYKMIKEKNDSSIKLLMSNHNHFITIFRDIHEQYYTTTFNSIIKQDDKNITEIFDRFNKICNHTNRCILNIAANMAISIHFNLDRSKFDTSNYSSYCESVSKEIKKKMSIINIPKLFEHKCPVDDNMELIAADKRFITIDMLKSSNGVVKPINSFTK